MALDTDFSVLRGQVIEKIERRRGDRELIFRTTSGETYLMDHDQDCCEHVYIEDICGDLDDLIGETVMLAEEVSSNVTPDGINTDGLYLSDSFTWTFYKLATIKGSVTIRWLGESNGYYSESVRFRLIED